MIVTLLKTLVYCAVTGMTVIATLATQPLFLRRSLCSLATSLTSKGQDQNYRLCHTLLTNHTTSTALPYSVCRARPDLTWQHSAATMQAVRSAQGNLLTSSQTCSSLMQLHQIGSSCTARQRALDTCHLTTLKRGAKRFHPVHHTLQSLTRLSLASAPQKQRSTCLSTVTAHASRWQHISASPTAAAAFYCTLPA